MKTTTNVSEKKNKRKQKW